jgi:hypothetical protein
MHKEKEGTNVKACYEFDDDPMKMCFEHKTRMKVDHRIKRC